MAKRLASMIVGAVALLALAVSPASAHVSSYTGHGGSGWAWQTIYRNWDQGCDWVWTLQYGDEYLCGHWHLYDHLQGVYYNHSCWVLLQFTGVNHDNGVAKNWWYNDTRCFQNA